MNPCNVKKQRGRVAVKEIIMSQIHCWRLGCWPSTRVESCGVRRGLRTPPVLTFSPRRFCPLPSDFTNSLRVRTSLSLPSFQTTAFSVAQSTSGVAAGLGMR